jgi:hypothetical protein
VLALGEGTDTDILLCSVRKKQLDHQQVQQEQKQQQEQEQQLQQEQDQQLQHEQQEQEE